MRVRRSSRLILLDEMDRALLFKVEDPAVARPGRPLSPIFWITPGGGVEDGESDEEAARRELWEECGIDNVKLGPLVAVSSPVFNFGGEVVRSDNQFFLARIEAPVVSLANMIDLEREAYRDHRWWSIDELQSTAELVFPLGLAELIANIIAHGVPAEPAVLLED